MKYASEDLMEEHEGILFGLKILEKMVNNLGGKNKPDDEDFREMINFLKLFADKCHHGKEEGFMFPAMEKAGIPNQNGPIGQMLIEHTEGRNYISQMSASLAEKSVKENDLIKSATNYIKLMRSHIEKENTVLFPMSDEKIDLAEHTRLLESFEKYEEEVMGAGIHDKLHELLHKFEHKYLTDDSK